MVPLLGIQAQNLKKIKLSSVEKHHSSPLTIFVASAGQLSILMSSSRMSMYFDWNDRLLNVGCCSNCRCLWLWFSVIVKIKTSVLYIVIHEILLKVSLSQAGLLVGMKRNVYNHELKFQQMPNKFVS